MNQVLAVFLWWLIIEILGLIALPLTMRLFRHLPDRGYALAKPLGLLLVSYVLWIGATFGLLHNSVGGILFSILAVGAFSGWFYAREKKDGNLLALLKARKWVIVASEVLFALAFGLWALYRAYNPETAGTEKPMDFGFLNAILRSETFPPHDPWLSGFAISYYYFGYLMMAVLTKLSGVPSNITFNLAIALLFALTMTGAFSLAYNLVKGSEGSKGAEAKPLPSDPSSPLSPIFYGLLASVLVAVIGNLEGAIEVLYAKGIGPAGFWRWLDLKDLGEAPTTNTWLPTRHYLWWWRASRIIHDRDLLGNDMEVIDEFPFFSFLLGDMHPHVLALPFVLLALALAFNWLLSRRRLTWPELSLTALCLGALGFLNTWDFPIYLFIAVAAYAAQRYWHYGAFSTEWTKDVGYTSVLLAVLGFAFYLPFYVGFQSQAGGLLPTLFTITRLNQYLVIFGLFVFALVGFLAVRVTELLSLREQDGGKPSLRSLFLDWLRVLLWTVVLPPLVMPAAIVPIVVTARGRAFLQGVLDSEPVRQAIGQQTLSSLLAKSLELRFSNPWFFLFSVSLIALVVVLILYESRLTHYASRITNYGSRLPPHESRTFVLLMVFTAMLLTFSVEFVYLKDLFNTRMNTIFKFYFQAWVLLAISAAFCVYWMAGRVKVGWVRSLWLAGFWALFLASMVYPVLAGYTKADSFRVKPTLDGTAYMANHNPDDHAAVQWLNENVEGAPVILEATGGSYSYYARVSSQTGLPTLLGWDWHEFQWRGTGEEGNKRKPDIETIYDSLDAQAALTLMDKYDIKYVYVGSLERSHYPSAALSKFDYIMDVVYQQGAVTIYKRR